MSWDTTTDKKMKKDEKTTAQKLKDAEDIFDFTRKEMLDILGSGNIAVLESGLCDGQKCFHHKKLSGTHGTRGCYCRLADPDKKSGPYYRDQHDMVCSLGGNNTDLRNEGCKGYVPHPEYDNIREKPVYMEQLHGRKVI